MSRVIEPLSAGMGRQRGQYRKPLGWYYYAKKSVPIFPGITRARCARFLEPYYAARRARQSPLDVLANAVAFTAFQAWLPFRARQVARLYQLDEAWARRALAIGRRRFADPNDIALFRITEPRQLDAYMRRFEHSAISKRINPECWEADCVLANKIEFYARCVEHGLPHPRVVATSVDGHVRIHAVPGAGSLVIKPAGGEGGRDVRMADFRPDDDFQTFLRRELGRRGMWVVQDRVAPHPDLAGIALAALPTARVSTMRNERGGLEIVTSALRFAALPAALVDNVKAGGLIAAIDPETGVLGPGCKGRGVEEFTHHPATGAPIEGLQLPCWREAVDLVLRAHREAFLGYTLIGWDVALTPAGPMLIEGNGKPSMNIAQRAVGKGVGETRFGQLLAYHLARSRK